LWKHIGNPTLIVGGPNQDIYRNSAILRRSNLIFENENFIGRNNPLSRTNRSKERVQKTAFARIILSDKNRKGIKFYINRAQAAIVSYPNLFEKYTAHLINIRVKCFLRSEASTMIRMLADFLGSNQGNSLI
jgi:hypothetical protein